MAKDAKNRFQMPMQIADALAPFVVTPIGPPPVAEMPQLSLAAMGGSGQQPASGSSARSATPSPAPTRPATPVPARAATPTPRPASPPPVRPRPAVDNSFSAPPAQPQSSATAASVEQSPVWANLASETPTPRSALAETGHNPAVIRPPGRRPPAVPFKPAPSAGRRKVLMLMVGILAGGLIILALLALGAFGLKRNKAPVTSAAAPGPQTLIVDPSVSPAPGSWPKVATALARAKSGDRILVRGPAVEEQWSNVESNRFAKDITVEADVPPGQYLPWLLPASARDLKAVLSVANMDGVRFKGFIFDGQNRAETGIYISSRCPGVVFDDCRVMNCRSSGVKFSNATGDGSRPIVLTRLRLSGSPTTTANLHFFASPNVVSIKANQHVKVQDCIVEGPSNALVVVEGVASEIAVTNNRFFQATDGVILRPAKDASWSVIAFRNNTFARLARFAVAQEGSTDVLPPSVSVLFEGNLFTNCKAIAQLVGDKPLPKLMSKGNVWDEVSAPGNLPLDGKAAAGVKFASDDPAAGRQFLRLAPDSAVKDKSAGASPND